MTAERKKFIQVLLAIALVLAFVRMVVLLSRRGGGEQPAKQQAAPPLDPNYYVLPKKLYAYDLESARKLTQQPVWVKEGYRYTFYPYDSKRRRVEWEHEAGQLKPIQKLDIKDVVVVPGPPGGARQLVAVFEEEGEPHAFSIGAVKGEDDYRIYADEMLFIQDPRQLYKHWSAEVWQAIEAGEVKPGMDEIQASFALGMGVPQRSDDPDVKTVVYPRGGRQKTIVTYRKGKAVDIRQPAG